MIKTNSGQFGLQNWHIHKFFQRSYSVRAFHWYVKFSMRKQWRFEGTETESILSRGHLYIHWYCSKVGQDWLLSRNTARWNLETKLVMFGNRIMKPFKNWTLCVNSCFCHTTKFNIEAAQYLLSDHNFLYVLLWCFYKIHLKFILGRLGNDMERIFA